MLKLEWGFYGFFFIFFFWGGGVDPLFWKLGKFSQDRSFFMGDVRINGYYIFRISITSESF